MTPIITRLQLAEEALLKNGFTLVDDAWVRAAPAAQACPTVVLMHQLNLCADDPMWANHAEVSKKLLRQAADALRATLTVPVET